MTEPIDPRELRVSDAERAHVVDVLQKAIGRGLIDLDEFTRRTDVALAARTRAELNVVLVDLTGVVHREATTHHAVPPLELNVTMGAIERSGWWAVPSEIVINNNMGSVDLDFTEAQFARDEVRIELKVTAGSVELLVPEDARVDMAGLENSMGKVEQKGTGSGRPLFTLSGVVRAGSLRVRRPSYRVVGPVVVRWPFKVSRNGPVKPH